MVQCGDESIIGRLQGDVSGSAQTTFSPRAQFAIKPDWEKIWSLGFQEVYTISHRSTESLEMLQEWYSQMAQQSVHFVLSNDYSFKMWDRFKLVSELYYKSLTDVNTYTIDNVRIRYSASNVAKGYAQGLDFRLNGEFVPERNLGLVLAILKQRKIAKIKAI
jgi:hypothetical protein